MNDRTNNTVKANEESNAFHCPMPWKYGNKQCGKSYCLEN